MLIERRRTRQRLTLWRMMAALLTVILLFVLIAKGGAGGSIHGDHIARVHISGMILDNAKQQQLLEDLQASDNVKAVVLRINSPGGTTTGGEALYQHIRQLADEKPVVAVFGTVAASAAYMAGIGADHIVTRGTSITGSVGVIVQWPDMSELLAKLGISLEELKSGKLKATPSPFKRADKEELVPMKELVEDTFKWFINLVVERRKIKLADVPGLAEGRIYTGRQAVKLGLADEIGGENEAVKWLETKMDIKDGLPVIERKPKKELTFNPLSAMLAGISGKLGLERVFSLLSLKRGVGADASSGLMSVWRLPGQ
jgi:protease-4